MQLLSGSADGLIRLWTIRTGECETTLDNHDNKVWAIAVPPEALVAVPAAANASNASDIVIGQGENSEAAGSSIATTSTNLVSGHSLAQQGLVGGDARRLTFYSGGSDSKLVLWQDVTAQEEQARVVELEKGLLLEQELHNEMRNKRYHKVMIKQIQIYRVAYLSHYIYIASCTI